MRRSVKVLSVEITAGLKKHFKAGASTALHDRSIWMNRRGDMFSGQEVHERIAAETLKRKSYDIKASTQFLERGFVRIANMNELGIQVGKLPPTRNQRNALKKAIRQHWGEQNSVAYDIGANNKSWGHSGRGTTQSLIQEIDKLKKPRMVAKIRKRKK